jgi:hypothetical protein
MRQHWTRAATFLLLAATFPSLAAADGPAAHALQHAPADASLRAGEARFLAENEAAMERMMTAMLPHPTGDVDRDFVSMMIPHHQGAIDMAMAELRFGRNERLRRLAQEIIVTQQQEIAVMRLAVDGSTPVPGTAEARLPAARPSAKGSAHAMASMHGDQR